MTKIDIVSGFLGAGKTSFIQRLLEEALKTEKVVLIENEFGEIGIDGGFLKESGIEIKEMNQGCICCSLVGDFESSLQEVAERYTPDRIIIEPSGVGKLSDIIAAVKTVSERLEVELHAAVTVVDAKKAGMYSRNFGEFFDNQIAFAGTVLLSRTDIAGEEKIREAAEIIKGINPEAKLITTPVKELSGAQLMEIISKPDTMEEEILKEVMERVREHEHHHEAHEHHHEHHDHHHHEHHHHEEGYCCRHHEEEEAHEHCCHHEEEEAHEHCCHHEEEEAHEHCCCHEEGGRHPEHRHHHHHDAEEVFTSWGLKTPQAYDRSRLRALLEEMANTEKYGMVVRAKGMLPTTEGGWVYFDMVPEQVELREGSPDYTGKIVVIGAGLNEALLDEAFASVK